MLEIVLRVVYYGTAVAIVASLVVEYHRRSLSARVQQ